MKTDTKITSDLSAQIAKEIRDAIVDGRMIVDERLPSEAELAEQFNVSRPTVREALKRLAAQSLIRTQRGAFGGAFVNRLSYEEAYGQQITTSTLLLSMNAVSFDTACEARYALERACAPLAAARRTADHLATMRAEIHRQGQPGLTDEAFCASDVAFHRALVDAAGNPVLSYQLAGAVEAMQLDVRDSEVTIQECAIVGSPGNAVVLRGDTRCEIRHSLIAAAWNCGVTIQDS